MSTVKVVGGSSGIGYKLSNKLTGQGYDVFATFNKNRVIAEKENLKKSGSRIDRGTR